MQQNKKIKIIVLNVFLNLECALNVSFSMIGKGKFGTKENGGIGILDGKYSILSFFTFKNSFIEYFLPNLYLLNGNLLIYYPNIFHSKTIFYLFFVYLLMLIPDCSTIMFFNKLL